MNIIDIDYEKLRKNICEYIMSNNTIYACPYEHITYDKPIILMNEKTLKLLREKEKNNYYINNFKDETVSMIFDCYIAIANWLSFGEVELK